MRWLPFVGRVRSYLDYDEAQAIDGLAPGTFELIVAEWLWFGIVLGYRRCV